MLNVHKTCTISKSFKPILTLRCYECKQRVSGKIIYALICMHLFYAFFLALDAFVLPHVLILKVVTVIELFSSMYNRDNRTFILVSQEKITCFRLLFNVLVSYILILAKTTPACTPSRIWARCNATPTYMHRKYRLQHKINVTMKANNTIIIIFCKNDMSLNLYMW